MNRALPSMHGRRLLPMLVLLAVTANVRADDATDLKTVLDSQKQQLAEQAKALADMKARLDADEKVLHESGKAEKPADSAATADPDEVMKLVGDYFQEQQAKDKEAKDKAEQAKKDAEKAEAEQPVEVGKNLTLTASWNNGFQAKTADDAFKFHMGGRVDYDMGWYDVPDEVQAVESPQGLQQGSTFRRARLRADGTVYEQMDFMLEVDFSRSVDFRKLSDSPNAAVNFMDVWVDYHGLPWIGTVRVGHQKELLSFYNATSSRFLPFMERPYIYDAYEDDYQFDNGITIFNTYCDKMLCTWVGLFQSNNKSNAFATDPTALLAIDARLCLMPIYDEGNQEWMNIGIAGSDRANPIDTSSSTSSPGYGLPFNRFTVRPLVRTGSNFQTPNLIDTGNIYSNDNTQIGSLCYNQAWGPLAVGAQYEFQYQANAYKGGLPTVTGALPKGVAPLGDVYADGYYVEALYFLTHGDHHRVVQDCPGYDRVVPVENFYLVEDRCGEHLHRGLGAWEVGVRYDHVNINDGLTSSIGKGGELDSITLALNWYLNPNARITTEYVYTTGYFGNAGLNDGAFHSLGMRFHYDW